MGSLFKIGCITALGFAAWWFVFRDGCGSRGANACGDPGLDEGIGITVASAEVCPAAGYHCVDRGAGSQVVRWPLAKGKLRVRVGLPELAEPGLAREVRDAAVEGILQWDRRPFPLTVDTGKFSLRFADFTVGLVEGHGGGQARVRTDQKGKRLDFAIDGVSVVVPPIRSDGTVVLQPGMDAGAVMAAIRRTTAQLSREEMLDMVRATASHEMGHALGLMHSDRQTDIMFPQYLPGVTPLSPSERDFRTLDALYALPNGARLQ